MLVIASCLKIICTFVDAKLHTLKIATFIMQLSMLQVDIKRNYYS